ncbi:MAG TPA: thioredoxin family protein [Caldilineaceae bacterium]|nr:thioredoxin family protein [Caldilineaceae bacterium]
MLAFSSAHSAGAKSLVYHTAPTVAEYLEATRQRDLLKARLREIRLAPHAQAYVVSYPHVVYLLTVVAEDSPATIAVLPVLAHLAAMCPRLTLRVLEREAAAGSLATLLGEQAATIRLDDAHLPLLLAFDQAWQCHGSWGPHPRAIEPYLAKWQAGQPEMGTPETGLREPPVHEMRLWYNSGLNQACAQEVCALLAGIHDRLKEAAPPQAQQPDDTAEG